MSMAIFNSYVKLPGRVRYSMILFLEIAQLLVPKNGQGFT